MANHVCPPDCILELVRRLRILTEEPFTRQVRADVAIKKIADAFEKEVQASLSEGKASGTS